jgi:hypothetical protein
MIAASEFRKALIHLNVGHEETLAHLRYFLRYAEIVFVFPVIQKFLRQSLSTQPVLVFAPGEVSLPRIGDLKTPSVTAIEIW